MTALSQVILLIASLLIHVNGVVYTRETSSLVLYNKARFGRDAVRVQFTTKLLEFEEGETPKIEMVITAHAKTSNQVNVNGLAFGLTNPALMCGNDDSYDDCINDPTTGSYPSGHLYFAKASRKLLMSFSRGRSIASATLCQASVLKELCKTKAECDNIDDRWENGCTTDVLGQLDAGDDEIPSSDDISLVRVDYSRRRSGGHQLQYTLHVSDLAFARLGGEVDNDFSLGLTNGKPRYMSFALWIGSDSRNTCTNDEEHRGVFNTKHLIKSVFPHVSRNDGSKHTFVDVQAPTRQPTQDPTPAPTRRPTDKPTVAPTRDPTFFPTKRPTTPIPTRSPTTGRPTKHPTLDPTRSPTTKRPTKRPTEAPTRRPTPHPTDFPTKQPTTRRPTKMPTKAPTSRPTTKRPTRSPTVPAPTRPTPGPTPFTCPDLKPWELCHRINTWYKHLTTNGGWTEAKQIRRNKAIRRACIRNNCYHCGEYGDNSMSTATPKCMPKYLPRVNGKRRKYKLADACPVANNYHFLEKCDLFPECPEPYEMSGCMERNNLKGPHGFKKRSCERSFWHKASGKRVRKQRCGFKNGICRAVGPYWYGRLTIYTLAGYFDKTKQCDLYT